MQNITNTKALRWLEIDMNKRTCTSKVFIKFNANESIVATIPLQMQIIRIQIIQRSTNLTWSFTVTWLPN